VGNDSVGKKMRRSIFKDSLFLRASESLPRVLDSHFSPVICCGNSCGYST